MLVMFDESWYICKKSPAPQNSDELPIQGMLHDELALSLLEESMVLPTQHS